MSNNPQEEEGDAWETDEEVELSESESFGEGDTGEVENAMFEVPQQNFMKISHTS